MCRGFLSALFIKKNKNQHHASATSLISPMFMGGGDYLLAADPLARLPPSIKKEMNKNGGAS